MSGMGGGGGGQNPGPVTVGGTDDNVLYVFFSAYRIISVSKLAALDNLKITAARIKGITDV